MRNASLIFVITTLALVGSSCEVVDVERPVTDAPFIGTTWHLDAFETARTETRVRDGRTYTIRFRQDGNAAIIADCNTCGATYERGRGNSLSIEPPLCTRMFCGPESFDLRFLNALQEAVSYEIDGRVLRIFFGESRNALKFRAG